MQYKWLNNKNNNKIILFLNGWGMDENVVNHLDTGDFDILMINDYCKFDKKLQDFDFKGYSEKYLIAWSMGVYVSSWFYDILFSFDKKIALSGTTKIIDDSFGIPKKIYNCTIKFFSDESKDKFIKNMFLSDNPDININRTTQDLKDELISIRNFEPEKTLEFDKVYIPKKDIIVPYQNQLSFWKNTNAKIIEFGCPHYIFGKFKEWREIC